MPHDNNEFIVATSRLDLIFLYSSPRAKDNVSRVGESPGPSMGQARAAFIHSLLGEHVHDSVLALARI